MMVIFQYIATVVQDEMDFSHVAESKQTSLETRLPLMNPAGQILWLQKSAVMRKNCELEASCSTTQLHTSSLR